MHLEFGRTTQSGKRGPAWIFVDAQHWSRPLRPRRLLFFIRPAARFAQSPLGPLLQPAIGSGRADDAIGLRRRPIADKRAENAELLRVARAQARERSRPTTRPPPSSRPTRRPRRSSPSKKRSISRSTTSKSARRSCSKELQAWTVAAQRASEDDFVHRVRSAGESAGGREGADRAGPDQAQDGQGGARAGADTNSTPASRSAAKRKKRPKSASEAPRRQALAAAADEAKRASALAADTVALRKKELDREKLAETVQESHGRTARGQSRPASSRWSCSPRPNSQEQLQEAQDAGRVDPRGAADWPSDAHPPMASEWQRAKWRLDAADGRRDGARRGTRSLAARQENARDESNT